MVKVSKVAGNATRPGKKNVTYVLAEQAKPVPIATALARRIGDLIGWPVPLAMGKAKKHAWDVKIAVRAFVAPVTEPETINAMVVRELAK